MLRKNSNGPFFGVCEGLGDWTGIDPTLVRLGFVLVGFLTEGLAIPAYLILAICMPQGK